MFTKALALRFALRLAVGLPLAAPAALAGCNSYNPDLGEEPFQCAPTTEECPDGYECKLNAATGEKTCQKGEGGSARADGGPGGDATPRDFSCADDSDVEPNDDLARAFPTPIPDFQPDYRLVALAICPDTDVDLFRFDVDITGTNVRADITFLTAQGDLMLDILNSTEMSIGNGNPAGSNPENATTLLRAEIPNLAQGTYYVRVRAAAGIRNNYSIDIVTTQ